VVIVQDALLSDLLTKTARGDRASFEELYRATSAKLHAIALRILRDPARAEDVLQEAFVKIWRYAGRFDPANGSAFGWMAAIVRNTAIDWVRRVPPPASVADPDDLLARLPAEAAESDPGLRRLLAGCLDGLGERQRKLILLAYCYGFSREELADACGRPVGTIKTWLHRGLAALRTCLEEHR